MNSEIMQDEQPKENNTHKNVKSIIMDIDVDTNNGI